MSSGAVWTCYMTGSRDVSPSYAVQTPHLAPSPCSHNPVTFPSKGMQAIRILSRGHVTLKYMQHVMQSHFSIAHTVYQHVPPLLARRTDVHSIPCAVPLLYHPPRAVVMGCHHGTPSMLRLGAMWRRVPLDPWWTPHAIPSRFL